MNQVHVRLVRLYEDVTNTCLMYHHYEELDGIAQNLLDMNIHNSFVLEDTRYRFNEWWENHGLEMNNFIMLYDVCMNIVCMSMSLPSRI